MARFRSLMQLKAVRLGDFGAIWAIVAAGLRLNASIL
jgi:hypothetical protein